MTFDDFDLAPSLMEGIEGMRYKTPTPIQAEAIPIILGNHDLIGCAQTGTGKTAAFIVPVIHKLTQSPGKGIKCLAIAPTRELAQQIDQQVDGLGYFTGIRSAAVYGGNQPAEFRLQKQAILEGADIVISTPGRLISHLNLGYVDLSSLEVLILDEADRMLDMGFIDDIMRIVKLLPKERQTLMFSATMAAGIRKLAQQILREPKQINLAIAKPAEGITQKGYMVYDDNKIKLLEHLIKGEDVQNMLIFASKKSSVDSIVRALRKLDLNASSMHSGKSQDERNETLRKFRANAVQILVATDILSRGIDIEGLSHVLNYDIPDDPADYVHRIGRTARADKTGMAIAFINDRDQPKMASIERLIEREIPKENTPEGLGGSPVYAPRQKKGGGGRWRNKSKGGGGGGNGKHRPNKSRHNRNRRKKSGKGGGNRPGPSGQAPA